MNGVRYLRVEDGDVATLGVEIMQRLYGLAPNASLKAVVEGFTWKPPVARWS